VIWRALVTGGATSLTWAMARPLGTAKRADTIALLTMVGGQMAQTILVAPRSPLVLGACLGSMALLVGIVETPGVSHFFGCKPLGPLALTQAISGTMGAAAASALAPAVARRLAPSLAGPGRAIRRELQWWIDAIADDELLAALTGKGE
jgi:cation-transporting ATPase I